MSDPIRPHDVPDKWNSFMSRIDDGPASVMLNFWYRGRTPIPIATHIYWCDIEMKDPQKHGMGGDADFAVLKGIDDRIAAPLRDRDVYLVARIRGNGWWQLRLFAPPGLEADIRRWAAVALADRSREVEVGSQEDADWAYYDAFLYPNAERFRWMGDREVVRALEEQGDRLPTSRVVEHSVRFAERPSCDAFVTSATAAGFTLKAVAEVDDREWPWSVLLTRTDAVTLDHIHDVVMTLVELADEHAGDYDGWGTNVTKE